jgi:hypothetical protein
MNPQNLPDVLTMIGDLLIAGYRVEFRPADIDNDLCVALYDRDAKPGTPPVRCLYEQTTVASLAAAWETVR